ncbi:MAG: type II toxin-antitoxin system RelE/ParE family toxin [Deltaproteobacteria bacterium]|nr:type II toxin-antitoxin system RelE/ParE family toxin [Deltaproteobacteria bacterium]
MNFEIQYHPEVKKVDLPKIDIKKKAMIKKAIEERLMARPEIYGKPLRRTLRGYWKMRVGEYRVVFKVVEKKIMILGIINRKEVYPQVTKRAIRKSL